MNKLAHTDVKVGMRFGMVVVLEVSAYTAGSRRADRYALCQCDCGQRKSMRLDRFTREGQKSCGCLIASKPRSLMERFLAKVRKPETEDACWEWIGPRDKQGYGYLSQGGADGKGTRGKAIRAHRASYELFVGPFPAGLETDHLCRNTGCVNPKHLEPVTRLENMRRRPDAKAKYNIRKAQEARWPKP